LIVGAIAMVGVVGAVSVLEDALPQNVPLEFEGGPRLKVYQEKLDLGEQKFGRIVPVSIKIANVGDLAMQFTNAPYLEVVQGCCPTTPKIGSMRLLPGQTTTVAFNLSMHEGMGGYHDFRLHLETDDPKALDRTITILSNWVP
jgi:hypothetical protein